MREVAQRADATAQGLAIPSAPDAGGLLAVAVLPEILEGVAQRLDDEQAMVGLQQFVEFDILAGRQKVAAPTSLTPRFGEAPFIL